MTVATQPARSHGLLVAHVASAFAGPGDPPTSVAVTHNGRPFELVGRAQLQGGTSHPLVEMWMLDEPDVGNFSVDVKLGGTPATLLVGVTQLEGVAAMPIRGIAKFATEGQRVENMIESADGDLVIDAVCAGGSIGSPGLEQTVIWMETRGDVSGCGNLAASIRQGAPTAELQWQVNSNQADWWVDLAASLVPGS